MWFTIAVISWVILASVFYLWRYLVHDILDIPKTQFLSKAEQNDKSVSLAELGLRDAVRRVAREAAKLPCLAGTATGTQLENIGREADHTYEDLLATAILNKVIDSFQKDNYEENISIRHHEFGEENRTQHRRSSFQYYRNPDDADDDHISLYSEPVLNRYPDDERSFGGARRRRYANRRVDGDDSLSSLEDFSAESNTSPQGENFSFMIKQSIEELTSSDVDEPAFAPEPRSQKETTPTQESWEENWLFQKKKTKNAVISTPVTMLVPKSSTEYRVLIGDRDAEDTTDLSDVGSDYDEPGKEVKKSTKITTPRTLIGGHNDLDSLEPTSPILPPKEFRTPEYETIEKQMKLSDEDDSLEGETANCEKSEITAPYEAFSAETSSSDSVRDKVGKWDSFYQSNFESLQMEDSLAEAKNSAIFTDSQYSESDSLESNIPKDGEDPENTKNLSKINGTVKLNYDSGIDTNDPPPQKGTIAEREHKKWENAIEMPNNPYTPENIEKRLKSRSNSIILPKVTSLQRRNSYRQEIDPKEVDSTAMEIQANVTTPNTSAIQQMFEEIVKDYSPGAEAKKRTKLGNYFNGDVKAQSCRSLIEAECGLRGEYPERSSSTSPGGVYLKDAYTPMAEEVKRFGRDYYVKEAKRACGSRKVKSPIPSSIESLADPTDPVDSRLNAIHHGSSTNGIPIGTPEDGVPQSPDSNTDLVSLDESLSSYGSTDLQRVYNFNTGNIIYQVKSPTSDVIRNEIVLVPKPTPNAQVTTTMDPNPEVKEIVQDKADDRSINGITSVVFDDLNSDNATDLIIKQSDINSSTNENSDYQNFINEFQFAPIKPPSEIELNNSTTTETHTEIAESFSKVNDANDNSINCPSFDNNDIIVTEEKTSLQLDNVHSVQANETVTSIPTVKERMKRFLSPKVMESYSNGNVDEKFHPHHSLTARSLFRRANSSSTNLTISSEVLTSETVGNVENSGDPGSPIKTIRERREFFERLSSRTTS